MKTFTRRIDRAPYPPVPLIEWDDDIYQNVIDAERDVVQMFMNDGEVWQSPEGGFFSNFNNNYTKRSFIDVLDDSPSAAKLDQAKQCSAPQPKPSFLNVDPDYLTKADGLIIEFNAILSEIGVSVTLAYDPRKKIITICASSGERLQYATELGIISDIDRDRAINACRKLVQSHNLK